MSEFDTVLGSFGTVVDVFNILSSVATLVLGFMGFVVSKIMQGKNMREAMELEYARRRELVKEACAGVRMEFAIGLFQNQSYGHPERKKIVYGVAMPGKPPENKEVADAVSSAGSGEWPPLDGDRVEANYKQGGNWYKGKIVTSYEANYRTLYDIAYDDGDAEQGVELSDLRLVGGGGESQSQKLLASQDV